MYTSRQMSNVVRFSEHIAQLIVRYSIENDLEKVMKLADVSRCVCCSKYAKNIFFTTNDGLCSECAAKKKNNKLCRCGILLKLGDFRPQTYGRGMCNYCGDFICVTCYEKYQICSIFDDFSYHYCCNECYPIANHSNDCYWDRYENTDTRSYPESSNNKQKGY